MCVLSDLAGKRIGYCFTRPYVCVQNQEEFVQLSVAPNLKPHTFYPSQLNTPNNEYFKIYTIIIIIPS